MHLRLCLFSCLLMLSFIFISHAQTSLNPQWLVQPDLPFSSGPVNIKDAVRTANEDTYVIGNYRNEADFDPGPDTFNLKAQFGYSLFLAKYDRNSKLIFAESFGSGVSEDSYESFNSIAADAAGNVYITGVFAQKFDFDPGPGVVIFPVKKNYDRYMFIAKYDKDGQLVFAKPITTKNADCEATSIALDKQNNICITGLIAGKAVDFDPGTGTAYLDADHNGDCFFAKYDANGNYIFAEKIYGDAKEIGYDIATDSHNNILITGYYTTPRNDFDPGLNTATLLFRGGGDLFFAKYSPSGDYIFAKSIGGKGFETASTILCDKDDNIILTGRFSGADADFDPGSGKALRSAAGGSYFTDVFVAKYDSLGNFKFVNTAGGDDNDGGTCAVADAMGNVYIAGIIAGNSIVFHNAIGADTLNAAGGTDIFFASYDSLGNCKYAGSIGNDIDEAPNNIMLTKQNNIVIAGIYSGTLNFNPVRKQQNKLYAPNSTVFFASYTSNGQYLSATDIDVYGYYADGNGTRDMVQDKEGNTYVIGSYQGITDFDPGPDTVLLTSQNQYYRNGHNNGNQDQFFAKYSTKSELVFVKTFLTTAESYLTSLTTDEEQNVYICGTYYGKINFVPGTDTAIFGGGDENISTSFFAKYDANGKYLFSRNIKMTGEFTSIKLDRNKNIYIAGEFSNNANFNPGDSNTIINAIGNEDLVFAEYDSSGNYIYAKHIGQKGIYNRVSPFDMRITASGHIILCGTLQGTMTDFDPGVETSFLSTGKAALSYFAAAYTLNGDFLFASAADTSSTGNSFSSHLSLDGENVILSGSYYGRVDLDPGPKISAQANNNSNDAFFIKYNSAGKILFTRTFIAAQLSGNETAINGLATDTSHNIYIAGSFEGKTDFDFENNTAFLDNGGSYLAKYDSAGNYEYAYGFTPYIATNRPVGSSASAIFVNKQNDVVLTGASSGNLDLDPGPDSLIFYPPVYLRGVFYIVKYKQVSVNDKLRLLITRAENSSPPELYKRTYLHKALTAASK